MINKERINLNKLEKLYCSQGDNAGKRIPPKYFCMAKGSFLYDEKSVPYLDFNMYNCSANFGYSSTTHLKAVKKQLKILPCLSNEFLHKERILLSHKIARTIEEKYGVKGRVHFSIGGAQAVEEALKIVSINTFTQKVFAFSGCYHGRTIAASNISSYYKYRRHFECAVRAYFVPFPYCYRCAYGLNIATCNYHCIDQFERLLTNEAYGVYDKKSNQVEYRAFIFEPVLGRGGYIIPPSDYFKKLVSILKKYNILTIADEVQMGFFRTSTQWAFENFKIIPDIIVFGKAISNGLYPLSGIWCKEHLISPSRWPPGTTHSTFAAHPFSTSAGLATFNLIDRIDFNRLVVNKGNILKKYLEEINEEFSIFGRIDILGLAAGVEICYPATDIPNPELAQKVADMALYSPLKVDGYKYGLILAIGGYHNNVFLLSPSFFISNNELKLFKILLRKYIVKLLKK